MVSVDKWNNTAVAPTTTSRILTTLSPRTFAGQSRRATQAYDRSMATVAVFGSSRTIPGSQEWSNAESLGQQLASAGHTVATGGYSGTMEAISKGARAGGGQVVGVTADCLFPHRGGPNRFVTVIRDHPTIASRIRDLVDTSDAAIVLPGSIGTATELLVAWNRVYIDSLRGLPKWPLIAVGQPWRGLIPLLIRELDTADGMVHVVDHTHRAAELTIEILG